MRKLLTAGMFGTILGIVGTSAVNASIVSSGFLDEKLTEYALSTALDLKANQSDFTELNTQISDSIDVLKTLWNAGTINALVKDFDPNKVLDGINGAFDLVSGFLKHSMLSLTEGWSSEGIGIRFEKYNDYNPGLEGMFNGWTIYNTYGSGTRVFKGLADISSQINVIEENYHTSFAKLLVNGETKVNIESYNYVGPVYPLWKLSEGIDKIGTLPTTISTYVYDDSESLKYTKHSTADVLGEFDNIGGLLNIILHGAGNLAGVKILSLPEISTRTLYLDSKIDSIETKIGELPDGKTVAGMIKETDGKIGELPTEIPNMDSTWARYGFVDIPGTPIDLPDTVGGMLSMLFNEDGKFTGLSLRNIMTKILVGYDNNIGGRIEGLSYLTNAYNLQGDSPLVNAVNANTAKIGTLPSEYSTVGAALTAIKGIAEDAKAAALAAIPDPKQEGSSGKFVLTVDIVGDNATYHWEKIDREGETTTTE